MYAGRSASCSSVGLLPTGHASSTAAAVAGILSDDRFVDNLIDMVIGAMTAHPAVAADKLVRMASSSTRFRPPRALNGMYESLKNWGRWGADDERGALNHLTDARRAAAAALVRSGESISLAHDLGTEPCPRTRTRSSTTCWPPATPVTRMAFPATRPLGTTSPSTCTACTTTHVDALSHMFVRGEMFGGRPASEVRSDGARSNTILSMADGVVGRGVLLDIPRALGCDFLDSGEVVTVADLEAAEEAEGVRVGAGDVLLVLGDGTPDARPRRGSTGSPASMPNVFPGCTSGRWRFSAATGSPTRCPSSVRPSGPSRSIRSGSRPWVCT